ncbi:hypothetical protein D3C84_691360 [compost metagenome]
MDPPGHQGPSHPQRGPRARAQGDAQRASRTPRTPGQCQHPAGCGGQVRQAGDRRRARRLRPSRRRAADPRFLHGAAARRPHRSARRQRHRQVHPAQAAARRAAADQRQHQGRHQAGGGLFRSAASAAGYRKDGDRQHFRRPRVHHHRRPESPYSQLPRRLPVQPAARALAGQGAVRW